MSVNSSPPSDATATSPGLIAPGAQQVPSGSKTFQDLLVLAGNWSRVVDPGTGPETLTGEPIELGDFSGGTYSDLLTKPGLRRFTFGGVSTAMVLGTLGFGVLIDETNAKLELNGQIDTVSADAITATTATFGGVNLLDSSGLTIGVGGSISAPLAIITDIDVTNLTIGGVPYAAPIIDTVNTATGLYVTGSTLKLFEANGSTPGAMTPNAQTFAGAKTFSDLLTASSGVSTATVSSASALTLVSALGTGANDVCVKVGTSVSDGSTNTPAELLRVSAGIGGTEVSRFKVIKGGTGLYTATINAPGNVTGAGHLLLTGGAGGGAGSNSLGGMHYKPNGAGVVAYGRYTQFSPGIETENWGLSFRQNANAFDSTTLMRFVVVNAAGVAATIPVFDFQAPATIQATQYALRLKVDTSDVATFSGAGRLDQSGTDSSGTPGAATINKPIGKSAIAAGASSCVITNSLVAAGDWVMITPHARDSTCKELIAVCTANTITVSGSANATATLPFSWEIKKRL